MFLTSFLLINGFPYFLSIREHNCYNSQ